jgi:hypothetical protein
MYELVSCPGLFASIAEKNLSKSFSGMEHTFAWSEKHDLSVYNFFSLVLALSFLCVGTDLASRCKTTWCTWEDLRQINDNNENTVVLPVDTALCFLYYFLI